VEYCCISSDSKRTTLVLKTRRQNAERPFLSVRTGNWDEHKKLGKKHHQIQSFWQRLAQKLTLLIFVHRNFAIASQSNPKCITLSLFLSRCLYLSRVALLLLPFAYPPPASRCSLLKADPIRDRKKYYPRKKCSFMKKMVKTFQTISHSQKRSNHKSETHWIRQINYGKQCIRLIRHELGTARLRELWFSIQYSCSNFSRPHQSKINANEQTRQSLWSDAKCSTHS